MHQKLLNTTLYHVKLLSAHTYAIIWSQKQIYFYNRFSPSILKHKYTNGRWQQHPSHLPVALSCGKKKVTSMFGGGAPVIVLSKCVFTVLIVDQSCCWFHG